MYKRIFYFKSDAPPPAMRIRRLWSKAGRIAAVALLLLCLTSVTASAKDQWWQHTEDAFDGGDGTVGNPYQIRTAGQLAWLAKWTNVGWLKDYDANRKYFKLTANIDLSAYFWTPIGADAAHLFNGHFDGNGFTISNMQTESHGYLNWNGSKYSAGNTDSKQYKGLFGVWDANGRTIKNLTLQNCNVNFNPSYTDYVGMLAGLVQGGGTGTIENVHVIGGQIWGLKYLGGIVGELSGTTLNINRSSCSATIDSYGGNGTGRDFGGIVGSCYGGSNLWMKDVLFSGRIIVNDYQTTNVGGILGRFDSNCSFHAYRIVMAGNMEPSQDYNALKWGDMGWMIGKADGDFSGKNGDYIINSHVLTSGSYCEFGAGKCGEVKAKRHSDLNEINSYGFAFTLNKLLGNPFCWGFKNNKLVNNATNGDRALPYPTGLTVSTTTGGLVELKWNIEAGVSGMPADGYEIQYRYTSSYAWRDAIVKSGNLNYAVSDTKKEVTTLFPEIADADRTYQVRIRKKNFAWGAFDLTNNAVSLPSYPQPRNFAAEIYKDDTLQLSWNISPGNSRTPAGNYNVQYKREGNDEWTSLKEFIVKGDTNYQYSDNCSSAKKTLRFLYPEKGQGIRNYEFRIKRSTWNWDDKAEVLNGSGYPLTKMTQYAYSRNLNTDHIKIEGLSSKGSTEGITVSWQLEPGWTDSNTNFKLSRKNKDAPNGDYSEVITKSIAEIGNSRAIFDKSTVSCTSYDYKLEIYNKTDLMSSMELPYNGVIRMDSVEGTFEKVSVSKGFYNDRVKISFKMTPGSSYNRYTIERRLASNPDNRVEEIFERDANASLQYAFDDNSAIPGVYYYYRIIGWIDCNGGRAEGISSDNIGFIQPYGVVSGKVTYEGGNAVEGVSIIAESDETSDFANRGLSLSSGQNSFAQIPCKQDMLSNTAFSYQAWVNVRSGDGEVRSLLDAAGKYAVEIDGDTVWLSVYQGDDENIEEYSFKGVPTLLDGYHHLSVTYAANADAGTGTAILYVDGEARDTVVKTDITVYDFPDDTAADSVIYVGRYWEGTNYADVWLDELRLWNRTLTPAEIANNYDRYITGKETGLAAYYRFDEQYGDEIFDLSGTSTGIFNENHGTWRARGNNEIPRQPKFAPSSVQLAVKGVTDSNGNYLITTVPYTGEGSNITLRPVFGVHEFNPKDKPLFFNQRSSTYSSVDFTDISAFEVNGYVYYENSNYPVEGAMLKVDGNAVAREGKAVTTDDRGYYSIKVPIGQHSVSVELQGHAFVNGGRYPAYNDAPGVINQERHNFQQPLNNLNFYDKTKVRLAGRVAGGDVQKDKPLGFGLSKANIGAATVTLFNVKQGVAFDQTEADGVLGDSRVTKTYTNKAGIYPTGTTFTVETDSVTGEFLAVLPPVPFIVQSVKTADFSEMSQNQLFDYTTSFDLSVNMADTLKNVNENGAVTGTLLVNDSLKITRYNDPVLNVVDLDNPYGAFGDSIYLYQDLTMAHPDTIRLYNAETNSRITYPFNYPVFSQSKAIYNWEVSACEIYTDPVTGKTDSVPLVNQIVQINNALASYRAYLDENTGIYSQIEHDGEGLVLDETGKAVYTFQTGIPNLGTGHILGATLAITKNGLTYPWLFDANNGLTAILLGQVPTNGSNFTTQGPDMIDIILHDPAGTGSSAFVEKGSEITSTVTTANNYDKTWTHTATAHASPEFEAASGAVLYWIISKVSVIGDMSGIGVRGVVSEKGTSKTTTTIFDERISTSSDPDFVGTMADVYIGKGTNMLYSQVRDLQFYPSSQDESGSTIGNDRYKLFSKQVTSVGQTFTTSFAYTQQHVLENVIPSLKQQRNQLLTHIDEAYPANENVIPENWWTAANGGPLYLTQKNASDEDYGEKGTYKVYIKPGSKEEKALSKIEDYNNWIDKWQDAIKRNEEDKVALFDNRAAIEGKKEMFNRSFDAGVNTSASVTVSVDTVTTENYTNVYGEGTDDHFGVRLNGVGLEYAVNYMNHKQKSSGSADGTGNSITFGYELAEEGKDALTIDIYNPTTYNMQKLMNGGSVNYLHGYTFQTRAGQTSCPYEPGDSTLFHKNAGGQHVVLNYGTFQIEKPEIYINNNKNAVVSNIPSGREATYEIEMVNNSDANLPITYKLYVEENSNPDGLALSIDGAPLNIVPRNFTIEAGATLTKTLKVRQTSTDILDYEGIKLVLGSTCDDAIRAEASIEAHFIPSSTDSRLTAHNTLVNINGGASASSDTTVTFTISEYDRNYRNFADLQLQYRNANSTVWTTVKTWAYYKNDVTLSSENRADPIPTSEAFIKYEYKMKEEADGTYHFRVLSRTKLGTEYVTVPSNEVVIIKDITAPRLFGAPLPAGGILTADGEVSVMFNEDIQGGVIMDDLTPYTNIRVKAEKNGAEIKHDAALKLSGGAPAATEAHIALSNTSFTWEMFFQRNAGAAGTLLAHGSDLSLGFNAANKLVVNMGTQVFVSDETFTDNTWSYLVFSYNKDKDTRQFSATLLAQATTVRLKFGGNSSPALSDDYNGTGRLYVGANANKTGAFTGNIHEISLWNYYTTTNHMQGTKSGSEQGLLGYWQLNEAHGVTGRDKARSRHLVLPQPNMWYSQINNYAAQFNGSNRIEINATQTGIKSEDDFTVEFWFSGNAQSNAATLFSVGDGVLDMEPEKKLSVGFDGSGKLALRSNGAETVLSNSNYLDNTWHHFALNVLRQGAIIAYVDGEAVKQLSYAAVANMIGDRIVVGARDYNKPTGNIAERITDNYFTGLIDEVRVWRASLTADAIRQNIYNQLSGTENGLAAYYPFNKQSFDTGNQPITVQTLENHAPLSGVRVESGNSSVAVDSVATQVGSVTFSQTQAPTLKPMRFLDNVQHNFVANNNKIILNITENPAAIEGTTLEIGVTGILDLNGNKSKDIRWTAFVNKNRLLWSDGNMEMVKKALEETTFTVSISNQSGQSENWTISNLPSWLSVNATSGTLQPLSSRALTFTIAESTPTGSYEETVYLTGSQMIAAPLGISLKVTGEQPDWSVNPADYENSMGVIGQLKFDGHVSEDKNDIVAAFVNGECVGKTSPQYFSRYDAYFIIMDIYGNASGEVTFKAWSASTGLTYPLVTVAPEAISFSANQQKGSMTAPVSLNAETDIEQISYLTAGWNWMSINTRANNMNVSNVFADVKNKVKMLKNLSGQMTSYENNTWNGSMNSISTGKMYKLNMKQAATLSLVGERLNPQTEQIVIAPDWNWIGYIPTFSLPVQDALADLHAMEGDFIKGQSQFAVYTDGVWTGSLKTLAPNRGYIYQSHATDTVRFHYPSIALRRTAQYAADDDIDAAMQWTPVADNKYPGNMSVIAVVKNGNDILTNVEVGAFAGTECRGAQASNSNGLVFLSIAGEGTTTLNLKVYKTGSSETVNVTQTLTYSDDAIIGSVNEPYVIQAGPTGLEAITASISIYPNPVKDRLYINRSSEMIDRLEILDMNGRTVLLNDNFNAKSVNVSALSAGVYFLRLTVESKTVVLKFIKE